VRAKVSPGFCVAVKLNSADFQRGGFSEDDARQVLQWLNELPVDLVELSGGSYEAPAMQGRSADGRTLAREAYFLEFAKDLAAVAAMPVMTTGGIRRRAIAEQVLAGGVAMVGVATALALRPELPSAWLAGRDLDVPVQAVAWKDKGMAGLAGMALVKRRLRAVAAGQGAPRAYAPLFTLIADQVRTKRLIRRYRQWAGR
jgi:2,4-dienoyl-CoA reductase-like NADH-dependent reductase (Old Yellow Enzyme family)